MTFKEYIEKYNISNDITYLDCSNNGLIDLKGIESLTNLKHLNCYNNKLTDLKGIESLTDLIIISCYNNQITDLKEIEQLKQLKLLLSDITSDIKEARRLILQEIRRDKISDIK